MEPVYYQSYGLFRECLTRSSFKKTTTTSTTFTFYAWQLDNVNSELVVLLYALYSVL